MNYSISKYLPVVNGTLYEKEQETAFLSGEKNYITMMTGDAIQSPNCKCEIFFGDDLLFVTHNSNTLAAPMGKYLVEVVGDGTKKLKIVLTNDSGSTETIGGGVYWV